MARAAVGRDADDAFERVADRIVGGRADLVADEAVDDDVGGALELDRTALRRARAGDEDFVAAVDGRRRFAFDFSGRFLRPYGHGGEDRKSTRLNSSH